ncbi:MAG: GNAT family N-acetyltransferase [Ktedonobacterales bacterium]|nr:GNAT family N-acetyltransferase [Ktedonobacterales bacterium]
MAREYTITTERLLLHALSRQELALLIDKRFDQFAALRQVTISAAWLQSDLLEHLPIIVGSMDALRDDELWVWVIIEAASRTLIGDVGFHQPLTESATIEIGYALVPAYQQRGYATEAVDALIGWAFTQPEPQRIIAKISPENAASITVARKVGMIEVASDEPEYLCFARQRPD